MQKYSAPSAASSFRKPSHCAGRMLSSSADCHPAATKGAYRSSPARSSDGRVCESESRPPIQHESYPFGPHSPG